MTNRQTVQNGINGDSKHDQQIRDVVFFKKPVQLKIQVGCNLLVYGMGLKKQERNEEQVYAQRVAMAEQLGVRATGYGREGQVDTGSQIIKGEGVRITNLLVQLNEAGYRYTGGDFYCKDNGQTVYSFNFTLNGEEIEPLPKKAKELFEHRFASVFVWGNLHKDPDGKQIRKDSIRLNIKVSDSNGKPLTSQTAPASQLIIQGNTYRLV